MSSEMITSKQNGLGDISVASVQLSFAMTGTYACLALSVMLPLLSLPPQPATTSRLPGPALPLSGASRRLMGAYCASSSSSSSATSKALMWSPFVVAGENVSSHRSKCSVDLYCSWSFVDIMPSVFVHSSGLPASSRPTVTFRTGPRSGWLRQCAAVTTHRWAMRVPLQPFPCPPPRNSTETCQGSPRAGIVVPST